MINEMITIAYGHVLRVDMDLVGGEGIVLGCCTKDAAEVKGRLSKPVKMSDCTDTPRLH